MKHTLQVLAFALATASVHFASAQDVNRERNETTSEWVGWKTLVADGASATLIATALVTTPERGTTNVNASLALGGAGGFVLAAPIVHLANQEYAKAGLSLGARLVLPVLAGYVGYAIAECGIEAGPLRDPKPGECRWGTGLAGFAYGMLAGSAVASALDATALGFRTREERPSSGALTPSFSIRQGGAQVGLSGTF
jgi:hypothetical protein